MLLDSFQSFMKNKVIANENDQIALVFYNTVNVWKSKKTWILSVLKGFMWFMIWMSLPHKESSKWVSWVMFEGRKWIRDLIWPVRKRNSALWSFLGVHLFIQVSVIDWFRDDKAYSKRIFLFTNQDNPNNQSLKDQS